MTRLISLLATLAIVFGGTAFIPGSAKAETTFPIGSQVIVATDLLNYRDAPSIEAVVIDVLTYGQRFTVADGPVSADGHDWYQIYPDAPGIGWVAGEFLLAAAVGIHRGDGVVVVGGDLNVRDAPGLDSNVFGTAPEGMLFTITSTPTPADGYTWYKVHSFGMALPLAGNQGWVAGDYLAVDPSVTGCEGQGPCPTGLQPGDGIRVATDLLNLREAPGLDADILAVLPNGAQGILEEFAGGRDDDYYWLRIRTVDDQTGWVARDFIVADPSAGGSPEFVLGTTVEVADGPLTLRKMATTAANSLGEIPTGTILTVEDGPIVSDGYTWYKVSGDGFATGWVAGEFLAIV